jgi:sugar lactone lactonase YvrE
VLGEHGVQVANQTRRGKLVLLETSTASVLTLDVTTGKFHTVARLPKGAVPNYATWTPRGHLLVTDYAQGVIWKVRPRGKVTRWFESRALQGVEFGTTGIVYRPRERDLLISQQTTLGAATLPTNGALFRLPIRPKGRPGTLSTLWTSRPAELPDGFGIGRSGHIYIAMAGLTAQLVELSPTGKELDRFPDLPLTGSNGSPIPFDTPCSATFHDTLVLVANQSAILGNASHQAVLAVEVGEPGRPTYLPRRARFRPAR